MGLKDVLDSHPLVALLGAAVTVVSTTAGVTNYIANQRLETEKTRIETEYKSEVSTLKARLASIERKVGPDEKAFFDVSRLILTPDGIKELDSSYKSMATGTFFVAEPKMAGWKYSLISELDLFRASISGGGTDSVVALLQKAMGKPNLHLWRRSDSFTVNPKPRPGMESFAPKRLMFFPYVGVQVLSDDELKGIVTDIDKAFGDEPTIASVTKRLDALTRELVKLSPSPGADKSDRGAGSASRDSARSGAPESTARADSAGDTKLKSEEVLTELFRGDLAATLLTAAMKGYLGFAQMLSGAEVAISSVQKKGNVVYVQSRITFKAVEIDTRPGSGPFILDQEIFLITSPKSVFLVKVQVPSLDGRSDAFPWITQWLAGFRMPLPRT